MNVGEYGVVMAFSTGFDMSAQTSLSIEFTKPDGTVLLKTAGVTLGVAPLVTSLGTFAANKYVKYTFANGDVDQEGVWSAKAIYDDAAGQHLISDCGTFTVSDC